MLWFTFTLYWSLFFQVFLHILADTLGSVGVIISAILMYLFDWMIADPICSIFIAIMIAMSVFSLIADSVKILMQRQPEQLDGKLQECYNKVSWDIWQGYLGGWLIFVDYSVHSILPCFDYSVSEIIGS